MMLRVADVVEQLLGDVRGSSSTAGPNWRQARL